IEARRAVPLETVEIVTHRVKVDRDCLEGARDRSVGRVARPAPNLARDGEPDLLDRLVFELRAVRDPEMSPQHAVRIVDVAPLGEGVPTYSDSEIPARADHVLRDGVRDLPTPALIQHRGRSPRLLAARLLNVVGEVPPNELRPQPCRKLFAGHFG